MRRRRDRLGVCCIGRVPGFDTLLCEDEVTPGDIVFITDTSGDPTHGGFFVEWIEDTESSRGRESSRDAGRVFEFINASSYHGEVVIDQWSTTEPTRGQELLAFGRLEPQLDDSET